jgi:hypothetical protein
MTRARIARIRIRVRGPLDHHAARRLGAAVASALPAQLAQLPRDVALQVADTVGEAVSTAAKEPR